VDAGARGGRTHAEADAEAEEQADERVLSADMPGGEWDAADSITWTKPRKEVSTEEDALRLELLRKLKAEREARACRRLLLSLRPQRAAASAPASAAASCCHYAPACAAAPAAATGSCCRC